MEKAKFKNTYGFECDISDNGKECEVLSVIANPSDDTLIAPHVMPQLKIKFDADGSERLAFPQEIDEEFWPSELKVCMKGIDAMSSFERPIPCELALQYMEYWKWGLEIGRIKLNYVGDLAHEYNVTTAVPDVSSSSVSYYTNSPKSNVQSSGAIGSDVCFTDAELYIENQLNRYSISKAEFAEYLLKQGYLNNLVASCGGDGELPDNMVLYVAGLTMHKIEIKECVEDLALKFARKKAAKGKKVHTSFFRDIVNFFKALF